VVTALIVLAGLLVLITSSGAWSLLPTFFQQIQYAYRLQTYVALACAGLVLLGALALTRRAESGRATRADRSLALGLGLAVAFGLALCVWQLWVPNTHISNTLSYEEFSFSSYSNRADALRGRPTVLPHSWNAENDYADHTLPLVGASERFEVYPAAVRDNRFAGPVSVPAGLEPFASNIAGGPYLVHVAGGARVVGRTEGGYLVLRRVTNGSQPIPLELTARLSAPVVLGRVATAAAAALLLAFAAIAAVRRRRRRSPARPRSAGEEVDARPRPS
jgi:hypothetical protein